MQKKGMCRKQAEKRIRGGTVLNWNIVAEMGGGDSEGKSTKASGARFSGNSEKKHTEEKEMAGIAV